MSYLGPWKNKKDICFKVECDRDFSEAPYGKAGAARCDQVWPGEGRKKWTAEAISAKTKTSWVITGLVLGLGQALNL